MKLLKFVVVFVRVICLRWQALFASMGKCVPRLLSIRTARAWLVNGYGYAPRSKEEWGRRISAETCFGAGGIEILSWIFDSTDEVRAWTALDCVFTSDPIEVWLNRCSAEDKHWPVFEAGLPNVIPGRRAPELTRCER